MADWIVEFTPRAEKAVKRLDRSVRKPVAGTYAVNMSTAVLSVRLPEDLKRRLDDLGSQTGRSATFYVREAVESYIDDLEYAYALKAEAEAVRRGEIKTTRPSFPPARRAGWRGRRCAPCCGAGAGCSTASC